MADNVPEGYLTVSQLKINNTMKYKLRAECVQDILMLLEMAGKSMTSFKMDRDKDLPDAEFEFEIDLELSEIIDLLKTIPDSHVMYQTAKPIGQYTGERDLDID